MSRRSLRDRLRGIGLATVTGALLTVGLPLVATSPAAADTTPVEGLPATVSAKPLPTWQVNGVGWSQAVVGNTVYVGGSFTQARPPGVAANGPGSIAAMNLFAYDITTGNRQPAFEHYADGQVRAVTTSPDKSILYVGGDFTMIDGIPRPHLAAFSTATNELLPWSPTTDGTVRSISASATTVYAAGAFDHANTASRKQVAAFAAGTGATLPFKVTPDDKGTLSVLLTPDQSKVVIGGQFLTLNGQNVYGMGAVDAISGASVPWAANQVIRNYQNGGTTSLNTDGQNIYGTSFAFGTNGKFEGPFTLNPADGSIVWLADCLGDTYSAAPLGDVVYTVGHAHDCSMVKGFPDTNPRVRWWRAVAFTKAATGTNAGPDAYGWNFNGQPAPSPLHWWPAFASGTYTGQAQAGWSVVGNDTYVSVAGEFPSVEGIAQQGLVRYAKGSTTSTNQRPKYQITPNRTVTPPMAAAVAPGVVRVNFQSAWDPDNENLTYQVFRDFGTAQQSLAHTRTSASNFWTLPDLTFNDLAPAGTHTYTVQVSDTGKNTITSETSAPVNSSGSAGAYAAGVLTDGASSYWRLGETSGNTAYDLAGKRDGTRNTGVTWGAAGMDANTTDKAATFNGLSGIVYTPTPAAGAPTSNFSVEVWFKTSTTRGGKLIGFGNSQTGSSVSYDRHIYMDDSGKLYAGISDGTARTASTAASYNDNQWHQAVMTVSGSTGLSLYVDGALKARDVTATSATSYVGYWRLGGDTLGSWPGSPTSRFFSGTLDDAAIYPTALDAAAVTRHYTATNRAAVVQSVPTDSYGAAVAGSGPETYWRLGETTGNVAADTSGHQIEGTYGAGVTRGAAGITADNRAITLNGTTGNVASNVNLTPQTMNTGEVWFKTTTKVGGKLFGLGSSRNALSTTVDNSVSMTNSGTLRFSVGGASDIYVDSPQAYNNGAWHHVVAVKSDTSLQLYVDGALVAQRNDVVLPTPATGYWRLGWDRVTSGSTSNYFNGSLDEFATYSRMMPLSEVKSHYRAGGGVVANLAPTAMITSTTDGLTANLVSAGQDADGTIASYAWDFGDGGTSAEPNPTHVYAAPGTYSVTLTVTDDGGATGTATQPVDIRGLAPVAAFTSTAVDLAVNVDASTSTDADGTIASYAWDFGDGASGTGQTAQHTYATPGEYTISLTTTDDRGLTNSVSHPVTVLAANVAPLASFTTSTLQGTVSVNASGSHDSDGSIANYAWDFGDGATGTGEITEHTYTTAGAHTITLTVTDNRGATNVSTRTVTTTTGPAGVLAQDSFSRTQANGWGQAQAGGTWANTGASSTLSVADGTATMTNAAGAGPTARLDAVSSTDTDLTVQFATDKAAAGGGQFVWAYARGTNTNGYAAKVSVGTNQTVSLALTKTVAGTETSLDSLLLPGSYQPGTKYNVRVQAAGAGTTQLRAKVWAEGTSEPVAWQVSVSDSTSGLQAPAGIALRGYLSGSATTGPVTFSFSGLSATSTEG